MLLKKISLVIIFLITISAFVKADGIQYPYPLKYINLSIEGQDVKMAFMDVKPVKPNGQSVILFHGKNFSGFYWKDVIAFLSDAGFRVIAPDQVGWGRSTKPNVKYTFEMLASNNKTLLDSLQINKAIVIGHSMGGMLATRFALMFPERISKLILEDPLGLEDYKKFVPYKTMEQQFKKEVGATYASYKKYQQTYYPVWKPQYEMLVKAQAEALAQKDFNAVAWINALTYQMIYEQPVLYEFKNIRCPTLLIVGQADRTILGKEMLSKSTANLHGNFPVLAKKAASQIKDSRVIVLPGVGHIPHIQTLAFFKKSVLEFLQQSN